MSPIRSTVSEEVRVLMTRRRVNQEQLAEALHVSQGTISKRLNGRKAWDIDEMFALASFFDVPITDLFGAAGTPTEQGERRTACYDEEPGRELVSVG